MITGSHHHMTRLMAGADLVSKYSYINTNAKRRRNNLNKMAGLRRDHNFEKLSEDHRIQEIEVYDVLQQVHISEKRNVVEMFSSFGSKIHLCGRLKLLVEDIYLCLGKYLSQER